MRAAVLRGQARQVGSLAATQRLNLSILMPLRNQAELAALVKRLYDPSSPEYHHFLSVAGFREQFAPSDADYEKVVAFAKANGFQVAAPPANGLVVRVSGTVAQVENAFGVRMALYRHPTEDRSFYSADREPSVPKGLSIAHIAGLNNYSPPRPLARKEASTAQPDASGSGPSGSYLAKDMRAAYYGGSSLTGAGQSVALVEFDGYDAADLVKTLNGAGTVSGSGQDFVLTYTPDAGGPTYSIPIHNVLLDGATGATNQFGASGDVEQVLDIAQVVGMAPGINQVRVYIGSSDVDVLNTIASENIAKQISISWTWFPDDPALDDPIFEEYAAQGQSVFAASGDDGAYSPPYPSYYPPESAWVTAVGGTHLITSGAEGSYESESSWSRSGGGPSPDQIAMPGWQAGIATSANNASSSYRNVPDVAMEADFDNYACDRGSCSTGWGGTSFAAPRWAGFMALVNEQSVASDGTTAGFLNMPLYDLAQSTAYSRVLHDVALGDNGYVAGYRFDAAPSYDLVTGWGSANGQGLIDAVASPAATGFQIAASPAVLPMNPGGSATIGVTVKARGGFAGPVALSVLGLPAGVSGSFAPVTTTGSSVLTLTSAPGIPGGSFFVKITGTSGSLNAVTQLSLTVNAPTSRLIITSPATPATPVVSKWYKAGATITVSGTSIGAFQNLKMEWAEGARPSTGWTTTGIQVDTPSSNGLSSQPIGTWDTSTITKADYYSIRLTATFPDQTYTAVTTVYLEPDLLSSNWPKFPAIMTIWDSGVVPYTDASGNTQLAVSGIRDPASASATVQSYSPDGSSAAAIAALSQQVMTEPAVDAIPGLNGDEIVVQSLTGVDAFLGENPDQQFAAPSALSSQYFLNGPLIVDDLDGDSLPEIVTMSVPSGGTGSARVYAWRSDGSLLNNNYPLAIADHDPMLDASTIPRVAVGDVNGDGVKELVVLEGTSNSVVTPRLYSADGTPLSWSAPAIGTPFQTALADLDHNGKLETIFLALPNLLHVLQPDGTERRGFPQTVNCLWGGSLAVGDLNGDGNEEIVVSVGALQVFNSNGTQFAGPWPLTAPMLGYYGPAVLADINGDGLPEIVTSINQPAAPLGVLGDSPTQLVALDRTGTVVRSWNLPGGDNKAPGSWIYPTIGDFNGDGLVEIAVTYGLSDLSTQPVADAAMAVYKTGQPYNPLANDWPKVFHDNHNTGVLRRVAPVQVTLTPLNPSLTSGSLQFQITVQSANGSSMVPTGNANLIEGRVRLASCQLVSGTCAVNVTVGEGPHNMVAGYPGDVRFAAGYSPALQNSAPAAATPSFSPAPGSYASAQAVALSDATPDAVIYYTVDGSAPTASSSVYSGPITVFASETIRAIATASGYSTSAVAEASYVIAFGANPTPRVSGLSPARISAGSPAFTVTVTGSDFTAGSKVYWGTSALPTRFVSGTQLSAQVVVSAVATAGAYPVTVQTPAPGGGTSNRFQFEVDSSGSGTPSFLSPSATVTAGATAIYPVTIPWSATAVSVTCLNLPAGASCSYSGATGAVSVSTSSSTPAGTYQITVVFSEMLPEAASAFLILPILWLPIARIRRRWTAKGVVWTLSLGVVVLVCAAAWSGCGGGTALPATPSSNPSHQATSSGVVSLTIKSR